MINFVMNSETKAAIVAALAEHGADRLALVGLGRIRREDSALATSSILMAWPADGDGLHRVALSDTAALIVWRAYILAEIAAGRGRRADLDGYCASLGVETEPAYDYVVAAVRGCRIRIRPCADADHDSWSAGVEWVVENGDMPDPKKHWASSMWSNRARAHRALAESGLALPGQRTWGPVATCLFDQPERAIAPPTLTPAESDALAGLDV